VFLSYASEDATAAQRIAEVLRSAGIEVWFDREELRGGDAWDRQIRKEIRDCVLFTVMDTVAGAPRQRTFILGAQMERTAAFSLPRSCFRFISATRAPYC
jgi:hypothetical protein